MFVWVTNRNNTVTFRDKFGGQEYKFPPGESVTIPEEAAQHIWGYGLDEKGRFQKMMRMGLANKKEGPRWWSNVVLKPAGNVEPTGVEREV